MINKTGLAGTIIEKFRILINKKLGRYLWLLLLCILCFGILIPELGFYWDDLPYLYQYGAFGPQGFPEYVTSDRPFSAWIFSATTFLFGFNQIGYHVLALILRWICAILFYEVIQVIWKDENQFFCLSAASIFAVYPGFLQQPIALIYTHHLSVFAFFLLSIYLMIINLNTEKRNIFLSIASILLSLSMFSIENFATLELIRPFILWKSFSRSNNKGYFRRRFVKTLTAWAPYLIIFVIFIYWRVGIFKFPTYKPTFISTLLENPSTGLLSLFRRIPKDFFTVTAGAWIRSFKIPTISAFGETATYLLWGLVTLTFFASMVICYFSGRHNKLTILPGKINTLNLEVLISSFLLFLFSGSIVWVLDLPLEIEFAWDRMTIAFIPAVALFTTSILNFVKKWKGVQAIAFSILLSLAVGSHFENGMAYKRDWESMQDFIWQLSWRIPSLSENSILLGSDVDLNYYSDNSLTAPVNFTYLDNISSSDLSHLVYYTDARDDLWFEDELEDQKIIKDYRSFKFSGNSSNTIAFLFEAPGCLKVIDPVYSNSVTNPNLSFRQVKEISMSHIDLIEAKPENKPDTRLFPEKESNNWCYFFEKADLARQFGDFAEIEQLGITAIEENLYPRIASEWLPFLEGNLFRGNWEMSKWIVEEILSAEGNYSNGICYTINRILNNPNFPYEKSFVEARLSYNCP
jgi:hypothetical protein